MTVREIAILEHEKNFFNDWCRAFSELKDATERDNKIWLVGPSSYLFSIGGVKFAVDLQIRRRDDLEALSTRLCEDISALSFVLITHHHDDHFCVPLIQKVAHLPLFWYLPAEMNERFAINAGIRDENCVRLCAGDQFERDGLTVSAFNTPHVRIGSGAILPELGYHLSSKEISVLIPADVRDYTYRGYPDFGEPDLCVSHLWAGDNAVDESEYLPRLTEFVDFSLCFKAKRYFLCHLYEIGREERYMWHKGHSDIAVRMFWEKKPQCSVEVPRAGRAYELV